MADAAAARRLGLSMFDYLQRKVKAPACNFVVAGQGRCDGKAQEGAESGGAADDPGSMHKGETAPAGQTVGRGTSDAPKHKRGPRIPRGTTRSAPGASNTP
jgi:hypothetical protein